MPESERFLHPALPIAASAVAVLTLVLCVSITLGTDTYIGGISYPFFSDTGRDRSHGQYYIFAVGLTITGILWAATVTGVSMLGKRLSANLGDGTKAHCLLSSAAGFLWAASPFLALVSIFDTVNFSTIHNLSAYAFFGFALIGVILHTLGFHALARRAVPGSAVARSAKIKLIIACVMFVCVLVYLPIGIAVACSPKRLTVAKCEEQGMSASYCQDIRMDGSDTKTKLWCVGPLPDGLRALPPLTRHCPLISLAGTTRTARAQQPCAPCSSSCPCSPSSLSSAPWPWTLPTRTSSSPPSPWRKPPSWTSKRRRSFINPLPLGNLFVVLVP